MSFRRRTSAMARTTWITQRLLILLVAANLVTGTLTEEVVCSKLIYTRNICQFIFIRRVVLGTLGKPTRTLLRPAETNPKLEEDLLSPMVEHTHRTSTTMDPTTPTPSTLPTTRTRTCTILRSSPSIPSSTAASGDPTHPVRVR